MLVQDANQVIEVQITPIDSHGPYFTGLLPGDVLPGVLKAVAIVQAVTEDPRILIRTELETGKQVISEITGEQFLLLANLVKQAKRRFGLS